MSKIVYLARLYKPHVGGVEKHVENLSQELVKKGHKPIEIPVSYISRSKEEGKKIKFFRDGIRVFVAIVYFRFLN